MFKMIFFRKRKPPATYSVASRIYGMMLTTLEICVAVYYCRRIVD